MTASRLGCFFAGVLMANSAPHLATAVTGRRHLTPLAGRESGPSVNGIWGMGNLIAGMVLLRRSKGYHPAARWDRDLLVFESGVVAMAVWMAVSDRLLGTNTR